MMKVKKTIIPDIGSWSFKNDPFDEFNDDGTLKPTVSFNGRFNFDANMDYVDEDHLKSLFIVEEPKTQDLKLFCDKDEYRMKVKFKSYDYLNNQLSFSAIVQSFIGIWKVPRVSDQFNNIILNMISSIFY